MYKRKCGGQHMRKKILFTGIVVAVVTALGLTLGLTLSKRKDVNVEKAIASFHEKYDRVDYFYINDNLIHLTFYREDPYGTARVFVNEIVYDINTGKWRPIVFVPLV